MNTQKRLMILGASILQLPAIQKAKDMGLFVIAVDQDKDAVGFRVADVCLVISTIDIPKVVEAAKGYNIDGVMTLASDMPMRTVAAVAKEMHIVGISEETALKTTSKSLMRECLKEHGVPIPLFFRVKTFDEYLEVIENFNTRFIVKPTDNSGSRGVFLVSDKNNQQLSNYAFKYSLRSSRTNEIIVEEYMEGQEVSVETLSLNGNVKVIAITDKLTSGAPYFVEMGHSQPSQLSDYLQKRIKQVAVSAIKALGIDNGPSHTEIIITKNGPKIVEVGARLGGDNITTHLVPLSTGIDLVECCIKIALGIEVVIKKKYDLGSAIRYFDIPKGRINRMSGMNEAKNYPGVKQLTFLKRAGDVVEEVTNSSERVGFVISQKETSNDAILTCEKAISLVEVVYNEEGLLNGNKARLEK